MFDECSCCKYSEEVGYDYDVYVCKLKSCIYGKEKEQTSKSNKLIDEEKLDTLANDFCGKFDFEPTQRNDTDSGWEYGHTYKQLVECFKAGYRKAKEE